ncbi:MAG TPA: GvpL/GvpF family gas vesicle protein [Bryobacterales bacterium]|nr:GvpL/GvpF family gas vesicle protein [Bryobacterales bacterium]
MLYAYFIARAGPQIENLLYRTLHEAPVQFVHERDLVAAVRLLGAGKRSTPQLMLEHGAVLATAWRRATVLPLRFGTSFRTEAAVGHLLAARGAELAAALERLDGKAEMGVRLRLAEDQNAQLRAADIAELARPLDSRMEVRAEPSGGRILELAHLIDRREAAEYRERMARQAIEVLGPRPPFHFLPQFLRIPVRAELRAQGAPRRAGAPAGGTG